MPSSTSEGVRTMIKIVAEINGLKEPLAQPAKYIDPELFEAGAGRVGEEVR